VRIEEGVFRISSPLKKGLLFALSPLWERGFSTGC
jgi:hypothetical protein